MSASGETTYGDLPGVVRLGVLAALWAIRALIALFVTFWGAAILTVSAEAIRGLPQETNDAELAAVALVLIGATPPLWWWLGKRRLLVTPGRDEPVAAVLDSRKEALVDAYWLMAKAVAFCIAAFVVSVAVAVVVAVVGEGTSGSDPLESDRVMTFVLITGTLLTAAGWWIVAQARQVDLGASRATDVDAAAHPDEVSSTAALAAESDAVPDLEVPPIEADDWPGAVELDETRDLAGQHGRTDDSSS